MTPKNASIHRGEAKADALKQHWPAFIWRFNHSESHHYITTAKVIDRCFAHDWKMMAARSRRLHDVLKHSAVGERLGDVRLRLRVHYELLSDIFGFYAALGGSDPLVLGREGWDRLVKDCKLLDGVGGRFFTQTECGTIFEQANKGGGGALSALSSTASMPFILVRKSSVQQHALAREQLHGSDVLVRFEFLDAIVRIATRKFVVAVECPSICDAIDRLVADHLAVSSAWPAWGGIDVARADAYRTARLYEKEAVEILAANNVTLEPIHQIFCKQMAFQVGPGGTLHKVTGSSCALPAPPPIHAPPSSSPPHASPRPDRHPAVRRRPLHVDRGVARAPRDDGHPRRPLPHALRRRPRVLLLAHARQQ